MKSKKKRKYHTVGTVPISNRKIIERDPSKIYQPVGTVPISNRKIIERDP